jgi:hypothetical protein
MSRHPFNGRWFGWLSKVWWRVECAGHWCDVCRDRGRAEPARHGTPDCETVESSAVASLIQFGLFSRTTEGDA